MTEKNFFWSCDWGSSSFRLRLVDSSEEKIVCEISNGDGVTQLAKQISSEENKSIFFQNYLCDQIAEISNQVLDSSESYPCILSGMITSAHGWHTLPYADVPFSLDGADLLFEISSLKKNLSDHISKLYFLSGVKTQNDVMRGEELEMLGLFSLAEFEKVRRNCALILPGTHSKHLKIKDQHLVGFNTFMTGEIFEVLSKRSVLQFSLPEAGKSPDFDSDAEFKKVFLNGVAESGNNELLNSLFTVRTNGLFQTYSNEENYYFLSGLLIGSELQSIKKHNREEPILLYAPQKIGNLYKMALESLGFSERLVYISNKSNSTARLPLSILGHKIFLQSLLNK